MSRRKKPARLPKLKQKKATLSSPVISPDDIITALHCTCRGLDNHRDLQTIRE